MTQTNQQVITESFQLLGVVREGRAPTPTQSANGLTILNDNLATQMKDGWGVSAGGRRQLPCSTIRPR